MNVIYVAGPYRSDSENGVFENIMRARAKAHELWLEGWVVICPHMNTAFMTGDNPQMYLDGSLEILNRCDAIYMLKDNFVDIYKINEGSTVKEVVEKYRSNQLERIVKPTHSLDESKSAAP